MLMTKGTELIQAATAKFREVMPGVFKVHLWGEPTGNHGSFTKFKAGFKTPMHTHTYDVRMVVISGTLLHGNALGQETRLGAGAFCYIPGGEKHTSACAPDADCLFYEEQPGHFDLNPVR